VSLLRRKNDPDTNATGDPAIDFVRRVLQNPRGNRTPCATVKDERAGLPNPSDGIDSTFCYGEESNPCA
jgi:hypothetical protein